MMGRTWIGGLGLVLVAGLVAAQTPTGAASPTVAVVDGVPISQAELDAVVETSGFVPPSPKPGQLRRARMRALSTLIDNILLRKFLEAKTRPVPAAELQRRVAEMEAGLQEQTPRRSLAEFLQERNKTLEQWKEDISDHIRWNAFVEGHVTGEKLAEFYKEKKAFFDGAKVRASHIVLRLPPEPDPAEKARLLAWKQARDDAKDKLEAVRAQLLADPQADFGQYARNYSQDPQGKNGGDLGLIEPKWFDEAFTRAAYALDKDQLSHVVETAYGMHLIKVTERKPGKPADFARVREAVREAWAEELRQKVLGDQRKAAGDKIRILMP